MIVYGSFYPWDFEFRQLPASPLYILLHSWDTSVLNRGFISDLTINIAIYIPLGMSGFLALRRYKSRALEILGPIVLGTVLSASIEMLQLFTPHRNCSAVDLANNMIGSAVGVAAGLLFARVTDLPMSRRAKFRVRDRCSVALLFCWLSSMLFPLFPALKLAMWRAKASTFIHGPVFSPQVALDAAQWFAVGCLLTAAGLRSPVRWLVLLLVLVPAQFAIMNQFPVPAEFIGAGLGVVLFALLGTKPGAGLGAAIALLSALVLRGLTPFHLTAQSQGFSWIPFIGFLNMEWQGGMQVLLPKLFEYGAAIWLLRRAGARMVGATAAVAVVLAGIEMIQTHLPPHVAEITDPMLAVLLGLGLRIMNKRSPELLSTALPPGINAPSGDRLRRARPRSEFPARRNTSGSPRRFP